MGHIQFLFICTGVYAVLIMSGLMRVENRSMMPSPAKGRCAMSVSKKFCRAEYDNLIAWLDANCGEAVLSRVLPWDEVKSWPGCIVAMMDYEAVAALPEDAAFAHECASGTRATDSGGCFQTSAAYQNPSHAAAMSVCGSCQNLSRQS
ncbi:MAG: hypothetical protein J6V38_05480 [Kiritimatiellae bacterium]|nr:hypothetical protein [Kiritimatiellia bacterium]